MAASAAAGGCGGSLIELGAEDIAFGSLWSFTHAEISCFHSSSVSSRFFGAAVWTPKSSRQDVTSIPTGSTQRKGGRRGRKL